MFIQCIKNKFDYYRGKANHDACNLSYKALKEILVVFHNCSEYDYYLIDKELAGETKGQFKCSGGKEKYITFLVPKKNNKKITKRIKFIASFRFMSSPVSFFIDDLLIDVIVISAQIVNPIFTICQSKMIN